MPKYVILVRGIPGSGKSTHVRELLKKCAKQGMLFHEVVVCSADDYFNVQTGSGKVEYRFDPTELPIAHTRCLAKFIDAVSDEGVKMVIVDNTFIHQWEMQNYIKLAEMNDFVVLFHEVRVNAIEELNRCVARNIHGVPAEVVAKMAMEFEPCTDNVEIIPLK